jgi:predicted branched-subunit amino acid permease
MSSPYRMFLQGLKAELPILIGVIPFGMIYGVLALDAGLTRSQSQAMSAIIFAGSAQIATTQLVRLGAPGLVMILTVAVINLRHALYSASLAPYLQRLRPAWKWALSYLLTDEAYVVTAIFYQNSGQELLRQLSSTDPAPAQKPDTRHWFFLGAGLALWTAWQLSTAVGIFLGAIVPASWSLDFTLALTFIALVVPNLKDRAGVAAAVSAGVVALLAFSAPYKLGLMLAALVGIACGMWVEGRSGTVSQVEPEPSIENETSGGTGSSE